MSRRRTGGIFSRRKKPAGWGVLLYAVLLLLFPAALLLQRLAADNRSTVELYYSRGVYRFVSGGISRYFRLFPFSCAELLLYASAIFSVFILVVVIIWLFRRQFRLLLRLVTLICCTFTTGYFLFTLLWGLNYNRQPLANNLCYMQTAPTTAALCAALQSEVRSVNSLCGRVDYDKNGRSQYAGGFAKISAEVGNGYAALAAKSVADNALFGGATARAKGILASPLMSYTGIEGIYVPFTSEPNVDTDLPAFAQPFDAAHEIAHFKGFAREDEANFVAYLANTANSDPYFCYSAHMEAVLYLGNALYTSDQKAWRRITSRLDRRAKSDLNWYLSYITAHQSKAAELSNSINDSYLKSQGQKGVITYDGFVTLLLEKAQSEK